MEPLLRLGPLLQEQGRGSGGHTASLGGWGDYTKEEGESGCRPSPAVHHVSQSPGMSGGPSVYQAARAAAGIPQTGGFHNRPLFLSVLEPESKVRCRQIHVWAAVAACLSHVAECVERVVFL